jgi:predicted acylesterase/phospholipase RssA
MHELLQPSSAVGSSCGVDGIFKPRPTGEERIFWDRFDGVRWSYNGASIAGVSQLARFGMMV